MINKNTIDIIGAGPAGLAVGYFAKKLGLTTDSLPPSLITLKTLNLIFQTH